jgi:hypothetical protein
MSRDCICSHVILIWCSRNCLFTERYKLCYNEKVSKNGEKETEVVVKGAAVYKTQTLVDCGLRITIDIPGTEIIAYAQFTQWQMDGVAFDLVARST